MKPGGTRNATPHYAFGSNALSLVGNNILVLGLMPWLVHLRV